jgi:PadR family transcriptional regulator PadR
MAKIDKSLLSGSTGMLLLSLLKSGDKYGYEMITLLEAISNEVFQMKEGTLYPVLHNLEKQGYVKAYNQENDKGRVRRYYHLTDKGALQLAEQKDQWEVFSGAVNTVLHCGALG